MLSIQLVSRETIKPSSPTPENLRHLQLSLLDQLSPSTHTPVTLFYSGDGIAAHSHRLKKSLSDVLTCFYPVAGRIKRDDTSGYIHVECNDEGVDFYEVRVDCKLDEFLKQPLVEELNRVMSSTVSGEVPLAIQLSVFECGGLAIGAISSHKIFDAASGATFLKTWAGVTRRGDDFLKQVSPSFDFAQLFPPRNMKRHLKRFSTVAKKVVNKPFLFEASKIALLKEKVKAQACFLPTSVEAVSALIWRCALTARGTEGLKRKPVAMQAVDIRRRMEPRLSEYSFGNLWIPAFAIGDRMIDDCIGDGMGYLVGLFRESVQKIKGDHIRELLDNDGEMVMSGPRWNVFGEVWEKHGFDFMIFSSWINFPYSEMDFGWGIPDWSSCVGIPGRNTVILLSTSNGGIESWVTLVEEEMTKFEQDPELLAFVSGKQIISYKEKLPLVESKL